MRRSPSLAAPLLFAALAVWGGLHALVGCSQVEARPRRPNIILVSVDCLRADHLSCYGCKRQTSPAIDALAAGGLRFERAISSSGWTLPSHLSMLTGLRVSTHGVDDDREWKRVDESGRPIPVPFRGVFVSEMLRDAGYATAGFFTTPYLERNFGFGPGFDVWERWGQTFFSDPIVGPLYRKIREAGDAHAFQELRKKYPELFDSTRPSSPETIDRALGWLDDTRKAAPAKPFFLFLHLWDAHDPYAPPAPYDTLFTGAAGNAAAAPAPDGPQSSLERSKALYDGEIRGIDAQLARLFRHLDELGIRRDTLIVLTGDHGEEFGEHGCTQHRCQLYLEDVHVPLIVSWPAGIQSARVSAENASHVDIVPTICAAAGLPPPAATSGQSLLELARRQASKPRLVISELAVFDGGPVPERHLTILQGEELRVLRCRGKARWQGVRFDLALNPQGAGPGEPIDLEGSEAKRLDLDLERLRSEMNGKRAALPERVDLAGAAAPGDSEELRSLGYAGSDEPIVHRAGTERLFLDGGVWPDK